MNPEPDRPDETPADQDANETDAKMDSAGNDDTDAESSEATAGLDPLAALQAKADENWDRYLRAAAELENVRKRAAREVENAHKFALERFATDMLSVCDSLEMALAAEEDASIESLKAGSEATLKQLVAVMQRFGVEEVDPEGEPFDPMVHEAMTMQPSPDVEPGTVLTVFQKGYLLNGRLLRPARVVVASEPAETAGEG